MYDYCHQTPRTCQTYSRVISLSLLFRVNIICNYVKLSMSFIYGKVLLIGLVLRNSSPIHFYEIKVNRSMFQHLKYILRAVVL